MNGINFTPIFVKYVIVWYFKRGFVDYQIKKVEDA